MTSFGLGEILIVLILLLVSFDVKQIAKAMKWMRSLRAKFFNIQSEWRSQLDRVLLEEESKEQLQQGMQSKAGMRKWAADRVEKFPALMRHHASHDLLKHLEDFKPYLEAKRIAAYSAKSDELDTGPLLDKILKDGKALLLPYIYENELKFARVKDLQDHLESGKWGILEPVASLRKTAEDPPDLVFLPGRCFDTYGGRIGRGKGHYDRYLSSVTCYKVGVCFDIQISPKKLNLEWHDKIMDCTLSEKRKIEHREG